jgi:hypothetical protein
MSEENAESPGQYVLKKLFADFVHLSTSKLNFIATQDLEYVVTKCLQRGEDPYLDQLLKSLNEVSAFCLKSMLEHLFKWRDQQISQCRVKQSSSALVTKSSAQKKTHPTSDSAESKVVREYYQERLELAVECLFCMVLVEVLAQLGIHPIPESYVHRLEELAFKHFRAQETLMDRPNSNPNAPNMFKVAGLYAEMIGVLSQARFSSVRRRFLAELKNPNNSIHASISIIEGMKFLRVKMFPVEELEAWFAFLQELANWFIECSRDRLKSAMIQLLMEILLPVAAVISLEVTLPAAKKFVSILYPYCLEQAKKPRHVMEYMPLVTVVLGVSEDHFFLSNWQSVLTTVIMVNLNKKNDTKLQRAALESLYRLLWVYVVRIKCSDNVRTHRELKAVVETLFPKQRGVFPKNMPLSIFVKIIQFIATERLDFAMKEVILELLALPKKGGVIHPERMNIGLRAFLLVADQLEKKEGSPPMPNTFGTLPGKAQAKAKPKHLCNTLTEETVKKIGLSKYLPAVQKSLQQLLRMLDTNVGRPLLATQVSGKTEEELCGGDKKPKLDLLKTCVASIPRLLPSGLNKEELIDLFCRLTVHVDNELRKTAFSGIQNLVNYYPDMRCDVAKGFVMFIVKEVPDTYPQELEYSLKMLLQILTYWRTTVVNENTPQLHSKTAETRGPQQVTRVPIDQSYCSALHWVESLAMVTICSYRPFTRKASLMILKEVRSLREVLGVTTPGDENVMDIIDRATPMIISRYVDTLMPSEKRDARKNMANLDIFWLAEKTNSLLELSGDRNSLSDAWALCLAGLMAPDQLPLRCPTVVRYSWPWIMQRLMKVFQSVDPYFSSSDGHKSSLRGRRTMPVTNVVTLDMFLWRNYLICACCGAPPNVDSRSSDTSVSLDERSSTRLSRPQSARDLLHHVVPLLYYDGEIMEAAITALGMVNPAVFSDLVEELQPMIREALDSKKSEAKSARKSLRRFRENLRVRLTKVFELNAHHGCFAGSTSARVENGRLAAEFEEFIDGIRTYLESESDNDGPLLNELRYHLSGFIARLVMSLPRGEARVRLLPTDVKYNLFHLCGNWCGHLGLMQRRFELQRRPDSAHKKAHTQDLSFAALEAMSALVCSGPVFDPRGLGPSGYMYKWLRSMLSSKDARIQTLGRKTLQQLLQNNTGISLLLNWVVDHCFDQDQTAAQLYFHALSNTLSSIANYPCDIVTTLHVVLFKTGDPDHHIRERAIQLLQFVHNRFYPSSGDKSGPDLISALTWTYYNGHVALSHELARSNPELTLPLFSEMVYRLEMVPRFGQRNILQYMVPWLGNIELVEGAFLPNPSAKVLNVEESAAVNNADERSLFGSGWGSVEGTRLVLYNLLCITARYGDDHVKEVEELWGALCQWRKNIHIAINFLIHNARTSSNPFLLQQVKKIIVFFARAHQPEIVDEVMEDMKSVEAVSFEIDAIKQLPRYHLLCLDQGSPSRARRTVLDHSFHEDTLGEPSTSSLLPVDSHYASSSSLRSLGDGTMVPMWVIQWRSSWKQPNGQPIPLPLPNGRSFIPTAILELLGSGPYEYPIHRCNFAVMFLSELVVDMYNFDWAQFLPQILHLLTLGFDVSRPVVFEHSKKLLINMVIVLACREDKVAASRARMVQRELSLRSPSASSLLHFDETAAPTRESRMASSESLDSILDDGPEESRLTTEARDLIEFISKFSDHYVSHWPYSVVSSKSYSSGDVADLEELVDRIIRVFGCSESNSLTVDWSQEALYWATKGYSPYAGRSFQVCRALHMSLNSKMMTSILARLVEYAADTNDDVQSYVMEIMLTMEAAVGHTLDTHREYTYDVGSELSWKNLSSLDELATKTRSGSLRDVKTDEDRISVSSSPYKRVHERTSYASPERLMSSPEKKPSSQRHSAEVELYRKSLNMSTPSESHQVEITLEEEGVQSRSESGGDVASVTETMSFDNRDVEASDQNSKEEKVVTKSSQDVSNKDFVTAEEGQKVPSPLLSPSPDSDTTPTGHSAYVHRRKHSRNQSMSKPMDFQETSLPADNTSTISGTSSTLTSTETGPVTQSLPVSHVSQVMSPLSHSVGVSVSKMVSSSQTSSPVDSPARSPVRTKKQMRSSTASTSKLIDSSEMSQSLYPPHQPLRRKGSEPSRVRVHELKMAFSRVKRWGSEDQMDATGRGPGRPSSLADTAGYKKRPASWMDFGRRAYSIGEKVIEAADLFAELFVTSVSMLESDYDNEFVMAMRLMEKVMDRFDLNRTDNEEKMDQMISKMNWANFPGVQALLLKVSRCGESVVRLCRGAEQCANSVVMVFQVLFLESDLEN